MKPDLMLRRYAPFYFLSIFPNGYLFHATNAAEQRRNEMHVAEK